MLKPWYVVCRDGIPDIMVIGKNSRDPKNHRNPSVRVENQPASQWKDPDGIGEVQSYMGSVPVLTSIIVTPKRILKYELSDCNRELWRAADGARRMTTTWAAGIVGITSGVLGRCHESGRVRVLDRARESLKPW